MPLDEVTLRRPDFVEGEPVVLADGQTWQLRRPLVRFTPADTDSGFAVVLSLNNDPQYGSLYRRYEAVEPGSPVMAESLALPRAVLLANYELTPEQVGELIHMPPGVTKAVRIQPDTWMLEYARGPIFTSLPMALGDAVFRAMDPAILGKTLLRYSQLTLRSLLRGKL